MDETYTSAAGGVVSRRRGTVVSKLETNTTGGICRTCCHFETLSNELRELTADRKLDCWWMLEGKLQHNCKTPSFIMNPPRLGSGAKVRSRPRDHYYVI